MLKHPPQSRHADNSPCFSTYFDNASSALRAITLTLILHCDYLATADRDVPPHAILSALAHVEALPPEDEVSKVCTDEDTDDDISVVVHGEQHDKVCNRELQHVEQSTNGLLEDTGTELLHSGSCSRRRSLTIVRRRRRCYCGRWSMGDQVLVHDVAVVLFAGAAKEFECDHEEDDADA